MKQRHVAALLFVCVFIYIASVCASVMFQKIPNWYITFRMKDNALIDPLFEAVYKKIVAEICGNTYVPVTSDERHRIGEQVVLLERAKKEGLEIPDQAVPHHYFEWTKDTKPQWPACKITMRFSKRDKVGNFQVTLFFEKLDKKGKWQQSVAPDDNNFTGDMSVEQIAKRLSSSLIIHTYK